MIIACPACSTRYVVPDSAIGVEGRTVRCAKCRHSWFQEGPEAVAEATPPPPPAPAPAPPPPAPPPPPPEPAPEAAAPPSPPPAPEPSPAPEPFPEPSPEPPLAQDAPARVYADEPARYFDEDEETRSTFEHAPPFRPRVNRMRMWTIAAVLFAAIALGALGAVWRFGLPDWVPGARPTFAASQPGLVLDFPANRQDRRTLPNGTQFFGASGTVSNVGDTRRTVPSILIVLRDARDRIVYTWVVEPPKRQLAPGETITINEAVTDVPRSAKTAEIGWKPA